MSVVQLHDNKRDDAVGKIELNLAKHEEASDKRKGDRAARREKWVKQHEEFVDQVFGVASGLSKQTLA